MNVAFDCSVAFHPIARFIMSPAKTQLFPIVFAFFATACCTSTALAQFTPPIPPVDAFRPAKPNLLDGPNRAIDRAREMMERAQESAMRGLSNGMPRGQNRNSFGQNVPDGPLGNDSDGVAPQSTGGLRIQMGDVTHPDDQNLAIRSEEGQRVITKYLVGSGQSRVVVLPDGQLSVLDAGETHPTDDRFVPSTMDQVREQWMDDPRLQKMNMKSIESRRFVFIYNTSEPFIRATRTILETMYPAVRKYFSRTKIATHEPEFPLVVIAFATEDQYQAFERMPPGVIAYYDTTANHVTLFERSKLSEAAPEVAIKNAISTIAHEGVHQILHNIGVQQRLSKWPMWLSEGLPEFFAPTSVDQNARWKGLGATNDLRMKEVVEDVRKSVPLGRGNRLERLVSLDQLDSLDYAYSWSLIHMLARKHRSALFACILEASQSQPLNYLANRSDPSQPTSELFQKHLGRDFADLETELNRHLASLRWVDPAENQTHYLVVAGNQVVLTTSPARVETLRRTIPPTQRFHVQRFPNRNSATRAMQAITR